MRRRTFLCGGLAALLAAILAPFTPRRRPAVPASGPPPLREARFWRRIA